MQKGVSFAVFQYLEDSVDFFDGRCREQTVLVSQLQTELQALRKSNSRLEKEAGELRRQIELTPERPPAPPPPPPPPPKAAAKVLARLMPKSMAQRYQRSKSMSKLDDIKTRQQQQKVLKLE